MDDASQTMLICANVHSHLETHLYPGLIVTPSSPFLEADMDLSTRTKLSPDDRRSLSRAQQPFFGQIRSGMPAPSPKHTEH